MQVEFHKETSIKYFSLTDQPWLNAPIHHSLRGSRPCRGDVMIALWMLADVIS